MWDAQFEELLRSFLPYLPPSQPLAENLTLRDFGLDSIATVELLASVESRYGIRFEDDSLSMETFQTPASLWNAVQAAQAVAR
ncbi:acyl carrier protein [Thermoactinospora rubra]|uniref:acyl carrier protein n=1 Tax=Thermoactinospora rubra TaxID=1088767 RepID=UPI000A1059DB|nr:acyl carrier protein [Thermoactinospora rubra]